MDLIEKLKSKQQTKKRDYTQKEVEFLTECKKNGITSTTIFNDADAMKQLPGRTCASINMRMARIKI